MKEKQQPKEYKTPQFKLVNQDESNKVFFEASSPLQGGPLQSGGASIAKFTNGSFSW